MIAKLITRAHTIPAQRHQLAVARLSKDQIAQAAATGPEHIASADAAWRRFAPAPWRSLLVAQEKVP